MSLGSPNRKRVPVASATVFPAQAGIQQTVVPCARLFEDGYVETGFPRARE